VKRLDLRGALFGPTPEPSRVFYTEIWFRGHNNRRIEELLPRLDRIDAYLPTCSDRPTVRGLEFRALDTTRLGRYRLMFPWVNRRYRGLWANDKRQIPYFDGPVVADEDDPTFTPHEVQLLNRDNVAVHVVTNERVARLYEAAGVRKPCHIIPNGVSLSAINPTAVSDVAGRHRRHGDVVVGYVASWLLSRDDRGGGNPLHNVDHLLELWDEIRARVPTGRLWLIGGASRRIRRRCKGRPDIQVFGRIPHADVLSYVANLDIALYPRTADQGYGASKVIEYMGCGVPTVAYDHETVLADLRAARAGLLVSSPREFVEAVERLAGDEPLRRELSTSARSAAALRDWDVLAREYAKLLDRYL
jgi:glycosyltransferase involved in cell wall biosynthesis